MNVSSNTVIITGGTGIENVYGGYANRGIVSLNTVKISNSVKIEYDVYGGYITNDRTAAENTVNLTGIDVTRDVYGARILITGRASYNEVTINYGVNVQGAVYGAQIGISEGEVSNNKRL